MRLATLVRNERWSLRPSFLMPLSHTDTGSGRRELTCMFGNPNSSAFSTVSQTMWLSMSSGRQRTCVCIHP